MFKINLEGRFFNRISNLDKLVFTKHLAVMIKGGISLPDSINAVMDEATNPYFKSILVTIVRNISNGQSLERALSKYPTVFDPTYINLVSIGEQSGKLEENLLYLSQLLEKRYEFAKRIQSATLYPALILLTAGIAGTGVSIFVLPNLVNLFESLDVTLPLSTKILLFFSTTMRNYGIVIFAVFAIFLFLFRLAIELPTIKPLWQRFLLSLPIFGRILQNIELTSLCRNLGIMLKSGLPLGKALKSQAEATPNLIYKDYLERFIISIEKGRLLSEDLKMMKYRFIPSITTKMIALGERTGKLEDSFSYLGDFFEEETDSATKNLSAVLEPILLIVIGLIITFMALAIITPIYQLTSGIRQ